MPPSSPQIISLLLPLPPSELTSSYSLSVISQLLNPVWSGFTSWKPSVDQVTVMSHLPTPISFLLRLFLLDFSAY